MSLPLYNQHRKVLHHGKNILLRGDVHYDEEQQPFDDAKWMGRRNRFRPKGFFEAKRRGGGGSWGYSTASKRSFSKPYVLQRHWTNISVTKGTSRIDNRKG